MGTTYQVTFPQVHNSDVSDSMYETSPAERPTLDVTVILKCIHGDKPPLFGPAAVPIPVRIPGLPPHSLSHPVSRSFYSLCLSLSFPYTTAYHSPLARNYISSDASRLLLLISLPQSVHTCHKPRLQLSIYINHNGLQPEPFL